MKTHLRIIWIQEPTVSIFNAMHVGSTCMKIGPRMIPTALNGKRTTLFYALAVYPNLNAIMNIDVQNAIPDYVLHAASKNAALDVTIVKSVKIYVLIVLMAIHAVIYICHVDTLHHVLHAIKRDALFVQKHCCVVAEKNH